LSGLGFSKTALVLFGLSRTGLGRVIALVHYLVIGATHPVEAADICCIIPDDDQLLTAAYTIFDGLLAAFEKEEQTHE